MSLRQRDLFDDSSMSFGDHLEELRYYVIRALAGLFVVCILTLSFGNYMVAIVRGPIDKALIRHGLLDHKVDDMGSESFYERFDKWWNQPTEDEQAKLENEMRAKLEGERVEVEISTQDLLNALHKAAPDQFPRLEKPIEKVETTTEEKETAEKETAESVRIYLRAPEFSIFRDVVKNMNRPVTLNVQEAFMTFVKVSVVSGLVLSSPWLFYNVWMFVAVGLYPHERKFVYVYGAMSLVLFLTGAIFCFYVVFPFVLDFLLAFNTWLGVQPQIRLSEWVSFAVFLPMMFGVSFQLPLVMVFLNRLNVLSEKVYRENRRIAILVIAALSMLLTPSDPSSMLLMMFPLIFLYEFGIWLCRMNPTSNPFGEDGEPEIDV